MPICKHCGIPIHWDPGRKSDTGKYIPIENETDHPHDCPKSGYNSGGSRNRGTATEDVTAMGNLENEVAKINKNVLKLIVEVQTLQKRIEGQMPLTFGMSTQEPNPDANPNSTSRNHLEDDSNADLSP
jgi:hypothetical protein